jgi:hypothetical protein
MQRLWSGLPTVICFDPPGVWGHPSHGSGASRSGDCYGGQRLTGQLALMTNA